jgi:two-component system phosphate regulon response regulator PhoB
MEKTVLVVEDEPALNEAITRKLRKEGIIVISVESAEDALSAIEKGKPDLVWLDVLLPGMNGLAFLQKLRANEEWRDLSVVVVSVSAGDEKIKQAFALNVMDYIVKSQYSIEDIVTKVKHLLDKHA